MDAARALAPVESEAYRNRLLLLAQRMLRNYADAEDAVQEAYLRWQRQTDGVTSPHAWFLTVLTRICVDRLRFAKKRRTDSLAGIISTQEDASAVSPYEHLEITDTLRAVAEAMMRRLSVEERRALLLREMLGYSYEEVGQFLNRRQDACRQLVHRAKASLRQMPASCVETRKSKRVQAFIAAIERGDERGMLTLM